VDFGLLGDDGAQKRREALENKLHLGHGNAKTFLKRANALGLNKEEILEAMKE
jgi:predicted RNase H-like nuclease